MDYQLRNSLDSSLYERRIYSNYSYPRHIHRFLEIAYVLEGELQITLDSVVQDVRAGEMALIFPHIIHEYHTVHQSKVAVFIISNSYIPYISSKIDNMEADSYVFKPDIPVRNYFDYSLVDQEKPDPLSIKTAVYAVFQSYFKSHILLPREGANGELLAKVLPYVAKNFREDISLKNLAKEFGYNYHYFSNNPRLKINLFVSLSYQYPNEFQLNIFLHNLHNSYY